MCKKREVQKRAVSITYQSVFLYAFIGTELPEFIVFRKKKSYDFFITYLKSKTLQSYHCYFPQGLQNVKKFLLLRQMVKYNNLHITIILVNSKIDSMFTEIRLAFLLKSAMIMYLLSMLCTCFMMSCSSFISVTSAGHVLQLRNHNHPFTNCQQLVSQLVKLLYLIDSSIDSYSNSYSNKQ